MVHFWGDSIRFDVCTEGVAGATPYTLVKM